MNVNDASSKGIPEAVRAFEEDNSWIAEVKRYFNLNDEAFDDLLNCFFPERCKEGLAVGSGKRWNFATEQEYTVRREKVISDRNWNDDMSLVGIVHLEFIARDPYKRLLHEQWLAALKAFIPVDRDFDILDYGSGVSSFTELGLAYPNVRSTLTDVDPGIVAYLQAKYSRLGERVTAIVLPSDSRISARARVKVDYRGISGTFDALIAADVLEHTLDPLGALLHLFHCVKPGGLLLINYPDNIEGDWHTPEAFFLRRWCFVILGRACDQISDVVWKKRTGVVPMLVEFAIRVLHPYFLKRSRVFAREYFVKHGAQLVETVRTKAHRTVSVEQLIESVEG